MGDRPADQPNSIIAGPRAAFLHSFGRLPPIALRDSGHSGERLLLRSTDRWSTRVDIPSGHPSPQPSWAVPKNEEKERVVVCCPCHARIGGANAHGDPTYSRRSVPPLFCEQ